MTTKKIFTVPDAAKFLRVHRNTIFRAISDGRLEGFRVGKRLLVTDIALDKFITDGKVVSQ